ncbi:MAG: LysM peptidoglycan-binding domain-containing protein [Chloroflexi bacterium]|nr:LysM peptidoglycan-binding domain-containing protein [Chloroflexota bacterium]
MAFTFVGSNENRYWVADDRSAYFDDQYPFSETAFYWFDLNDAIPPNTWVEIEVFVHEQIYDPTYTYITGFYIKNGEDFLNTIYVDDVKINRLPNPNAEPTRERSETNNDGAVGPMVTPEPTLTPTSILTTTIETTPTATITDVTACVVDPPENWVSYTVQPGDTASSLSVRSGISVEYLATVNCLPSAAVLSVNRDIWLPAQIETITATPAPPPAPHCYAISINRGDSLYTIGFVIERVFGHITHGKNLRDNVAHDAAIQSHWINLFWRTKGLAGKLPVYKSNWTVHAGLQARSGISKLQRQFPLDGLFFHTQTPAVLSQKWVRRFPTVISLDATPLQYDQLGGFYAHDTGPSWLESKNGS